MVERQGPWLPVRLPHSQAGSCGGFGLGANRVAEKSPRPARMTQTEDTLFALLVARPRMFPVLLCDSASRPDFLQSCVPRIVFAQLPRGPPARAIETCVMATHGEGRCAQGPSWEG